MTKRLFLPALAVSAIWMAACEANQRPEPATGEEKAAAESAEAPETRRAKAVLEAKSGSQLTGEAYFVQKGDQVEFGVNIQNVSPGAHGVHIHAIGDCSAEDGSSAGGHWNPTNEEHGTWGVEPFHLGDIGNIDVDAEGGGTLTMTTTRDLWNLDDTGEHSVLGKSIVVHAGPDDFKSQPSGDAGARIGCGVIELQPQS